MDQGPPDTKRPRLSMPSSPWSAGGLNHGVPLLHPPGPSPTTGHLPHHPPSATSPYQRSPPHAYPRPLEHHPSHPNPPPPPGPGPGPHMPTPIDDRRQHEAERYPPIQEHRQPSQSPAHPVFPPYPSRDPMVKPDPGGGDDTLPQLRRPHSTGNASDTMTPGTPHSAHPSQPYPPDEKRHMSFDSGPPQSALYRQPSYPPSTPLGHTQPYDFPPPSYGGPHGELPYSISIAAASGKRKATRASQACDMCRQLKAKCDELKPCKSCKEKKVECKYRETAPKQQDKVAADILENLLILRNEFGTLRNEFGTRLSRIESEMFARRGAPSSEAQPEPMQEDSDRPETSYSPEPAAEETYSSSPGETVMGTQAPITSAQARDITRNMEQETETEPGPHVRPGVPTIPPNHTTVAALLLKWRPIEALVGRYVRAEGIKYIEEYPIRQEERRGILRVWGRGEGDSMRVDKESAHDLGMMEARDDYLDTGAPSPADAWGGISHSPGPASAEATYSGRSLDLRESEVWKYVRSYQEHIQNMHPLIIPVELDAMVKVFLDSVQHLSKKAKMEVAGVAKFVGGMSSEAGAKRKRSPVPDGTESPALPSPRLGKPTFQRSINNALVLLVLALGKICDWRHGKLPDVVPVSDHSRGSPVVRNGHLTSPIQGSPPSHEFPSHHSPKDGSERSGSSRRASFQGSGPNFKPSTPAKRNMDVIPGLDYFAYATDILGGQLAGTSLRHIHAYILAGLYHGQLGRVMESFAYIKEAGWALQIKMRPSLARFKKFHDNMALNHQTPVTEKSDNQLLFTFWTCLQLESDIIAELPLPQSHILAFEDMMPYPSLDIARQFGFDDNILRSYVAQLYLRKSLNKIHGILYNPDPQPFQQLAGIPSENFLEYIQNTLDMKFVPREFYFNVNDPPAKDLLSARLRAKYWGALVITYRPFIKQILEYNFSKARGEVPAPLSADPRGNTYVPFAGDGARLTAEGIPVTIFEFAIKGIRALIESTRAFHSVEDKRFIITNVFGTAHAQWGNLLTLGAVYKDPVLGQFVDETILRELFRRTIAFFHIISQPSSALGIDMRILEGLQHELWGRQGQASGSGYDVNAGSSFSSNTSVGPPAPALNPMPAPLGPPGPPASTGPLVHQGPGTPTDPTMPATPAMNAMSNMSSSLPPPSTAQTQMMSPPAPMGMGSPLPGMVHGALPPMQSQRPPT